MRLTNKCHYAVNAMLELALAEGKKPMTLARISEKNGISLSYLEQLFSDLKSKQLVRGIRGPGGGYFLAHHQSEISIADIICAVDEWVDMVHGDNTSMKAPSPDTVRGMWDELSNQIFEYLADIKLSELIDREKTQRISGDDHRQAA